MSHYLSVLEQRVGAEVKQNVCGFSCGHTENLQAQVSMELWVSMHKLVHLTHTLWGQFPRAQQTLQAKQTIRAAKFTCIRDEKERKNNTDSRDTNHVKLEDISCKQHQQNTKTSEISSNYMGSIMENKKSSQCPTVYEL
jgi:hypothetical protein